MPTWKLEIEYDGTRYRGWQIQHNARTIQAEMTDAARNLFASRPEIFGSTATDAGVHAVRQIVHLKVAEVSEGLTPNKIRFGFNDILPHDIHVRKVTNAPDDFHARNDAAGRVYLYQISTQRTAFAKNFVWWIKDELDAGAMAKAAALLTGRHNFASFCEMEEMRGSSTSVDIRLASVFVDGGLICFRIGASHFLPKMVRRIVGTLAEVGRGNINIEAFARLLKFQSDSPARFTAPPSGLFLEKVIYKGDEPPAGRNGIISVP